MDELMTDRLSNKVNAVHDQICWKPAFKFKLREYENVYFDHGSSIFRISSTNFYHCVKSVTTRFAYSKIVNQVLKQLNFAKEFVAFISTGSFSQIPGPVCFKLPPSSVILAGGVSSRGECRVNFDCTAFPNSKKSLKDFRIITADMTIWMTIWVVFN
ncbi:hypothetical protein HELRODRAFT_169108 [Helobdella robusta]|uniref:Uncharacterized protein n=1 Tax=Helobdella robusta TaxID=6412 RepID=T1F1E6_HELRO|nr:hypothetical protein HELRODRAFT_169108 [Helobdella robusta]ESO09163.1 hypothetical protein HELRODRAFT_169108 [Helobdella robusta]